VLVMQRMMPVKLDVRRWLAGSLMLLACLLSVIYMPVKADGIMMNIGLIMVGLVVAGSVMLALLWRNTALSRLLAVSLRSA